jgi:hypothetical protein
MINHNASRLINHIPFRSAARDIIFKQLFTAAAAHSFRLHFMCNKLCNTRERERKKINDWGILFQLLTAIRVGRDLHKSSKDEHRICRMNQLFPKLDRAEPERRDKQLNEG